MPTEQQRKYDPFFADSGLPTRERFLDSDNQQVDLGALNLLQQRHIQSQGKATGFRPTQGGITGSGYGSEMNEMLEEASDVLQDSGNIFEENLQQRNTFRTSQHASDSRPDTTPLRRGGPQGGRGLSRTQFDQRQSAAGDAPDTSGMESGNLGVTGTTGMMGSIAMGLLGTVLGMPMSGLSLLGSVFGRPVMSALMDSLGFGDSDSLGEDASQGNADIGGTASLGATGMGGNPALGEIAFDIDEGSLAGPPPAQGAFGISVGQNVTGPASGTGIGAVGPGAGPAAGGGLGGASGPGDASGEGGW